MPAGVRQRVPLLAEQSQSSTKTLRMLTRALVCPTLVGRDEELAQLVDCRLAAARGHGSFVLVSGDAGIGKSRLLVAFRQTMTGGRAAMTMGLNREFGNPPYGAVLEAFRSLSLRTVFSHAQTRAEQVAALVEHLAAACARRCTVLFIEDIHWADDGTLLFLQHLLPMVSGMRLLVVTTYRSDDVNRLEHLQPYLIRLQRNRATRSLELEPLPPAEMRRLVRLALGPEMRLQSPAVEEIAERSDGNPFFAEELLKYTLETSACAMPAELPATVRQTVLERVSGLDSQSREILSRASVLGRRFDAEFLTELCGLSATEVLTALRGLRNLQIIDELTTERAAFAFRHALTQEAIYGELLDAERKPLHARILAALEKRAADAGALGYHAWAAGDGEKCVIYNERAGDDAQAMHVYGEAVRCYDRAIAHTADAPVRARVLAKSARSCASDGKPAQSIDRYAAAVDAFESCGNTKALVDLRLAMSAQARAAGDNARGVRILESAITSMPEAGARDRAMMALSLAYLRLDRGDVAAGKALVEQAAVMRDTAHFQNALQYAELVAGDVAAFRAVARANVAFHATLGEAERLRAGFNRGFGFTILGCDGEALEEFDAILPELRVTRLASFEILARANSALIHARAGRLSQALTCIERAAGVPEPTTTGPIALAAAALTVGFALWDEELIARLCTAEIVEAAFASGINSTLGRIAGPYATWLHACGNVEGAQAILTRAMSLLDAPFGATETLLAAAQIGGQKARSAAFAYIPALDGMSKADIYVASAHHLRALRAMHAGDEAGASTHAANALACYNRLGWAMHQSACVDLSGDTKRASVSYRRMHAAGPLRSIRSRSCAAPDAAPLSAREREIASLVARGTVNKHIAERLSVNQRTVEKHLTAIYEKLGLRNRSELAAYVAREMAP